MIDPGFRLDDVRENQVQKQRAALRKSSLSCANQRRNDLVVLAPVEMKWKQFACLDQRPTLKDKRAHEEFSTRTNEDYRERKLWKVDQRQMEKSLFSKPVECV